MSEKNVFAGCEKLEPTWSHQAHKVQKRDHAGASQTDASMIMYTANDVFEQVGKIERFLGGRIQQRGLEKKQIKIPN
jgi:hypothetical protein